MPKQLANCKSPMHGEKFIATNSSAAAINTFEDKLHTVESPQKNPF